MRTIVYMAHPDISHSSSHQFLLSSGKATTQAVFVDLSEQYQQQGYTFDIQAERERLLQFDQIIFQFQLYWYQAPAIMKIWLDAVFDLEYSDERFRQELADKNLGLVVIAGAKAEHYQAGGREGRTLSELLSPYELFARHFNLNYLMPLAIHQFHYMDEPMKFDLMMHYACFIETGVANSFTALQYYIIEKLEKLTENELDLSETDQLMLEMFTNELSDQADDLNDLNQLNEFW